MKKINKNAHYFFLCLYSYCYFSGIYIDHLDIIQKILVLVPN